MSKVFLRRVTKSELVEMQVKALGPRTVYAMFLWVARQKNYKNGWAFHKFEELFEKKPKPLTPVSPQQPSSLLIQWLGIERRRWQARKKREEAKIGLAILGAVQNHQPFQFSGEGLDVTDHPASDASQYRGEARIES